MAIFVDFGRTFLVMVVFTLIVQWAVGRASATRAAKRMNRQRMRKLR